MQKSDKFQRFRNNITTKKSVVEIASLQNTVRNYAKYTILKNNISWFALGCMTVTRISKEDSDLQLAY